MKTIVQVKGVRFAVECDYSPADPAVGCHASVELCSVCQEGAEDQIDILCFLSVEACNLIEEAIIAGLPSYAEEQGDHADYLRACARDERWAA